MKKATFFGCLICNEDRTVTLFVTCRNSYQERLTILRTYDIRFSLYIYITLSKLYEIRYGHHRSLTQLCFGPKTPSLQEDPDSSGFVSGCDHRPQDFCFNFFLTKSQDQLSNPESFWGLRSYRIHHCMHQLSMT